MTLKRNLQAARLEETTEDETSGKEPVTEAEDTDGPFDVNTDDEIEARTQKLENELRKLKELANNKPKRPARATSRISSLEPMSNGVEKLIEKAAGDRSHRLSGVRERNQC